MDSVSFREATLSDAPAIATVIHAAYEQYRGHLDPPSGAHGETVDTIRQKMATAQVLLAMIGGEVVGCVFYESASDHIYLSRLAVLPRYRHQGIGRELIRRVEAFAGAHGYARVRLSVRVPLVDNRALYERLGYRVVSYASHLGYAESTYVNMEKDLAENPGETGSEDK